jgi:hypothetical protein
MVGTHHEPRGGATRPRHRAAAVPRHRPNRGTMLTMNHPDWG